MSSRNMFEFIGNLGKSPEMKNLDNGQVMTKLFVITNASWRDKQTGERKERSEAFGVVAFGHHAKFLSQYARKGDKVLLKGEVRNSEWTDRDTGQKRTGFEFIVSGYSADAKIFGKPIKENNTGDHPGDSDTPPPYVGAADSHEYAHASNGGYHV